LVGESYRQIDNQPNEYIYCQRYVRANQQWEAEKLLTLGGTDNYKPAMITDQTGNIWVFWYSSRQIDKQRNQDIYYRRYTKDWEPEKRLTTAVENDYYPTATVDSSGNIWAFWQSFRQIDQIQNEDIYYIYFTGNPPKWSNEFRFTYEDNLDEQPLALTTRRGETWLFWLSDRSGSRDIWYQRIWSNDTQLNTGTSWIWNYQVIEDSRGDLWVFWQDNNGLYYKHYTGSWGLTTQLVTNSVAYFAVTESITGSVTISWIQQAKPGIQNYKILQQQLITAI